MNTIIFIFALLTTIIITLIVYKKQKYEGLQILLITYTILGTIIPLKEISIFALPIPISLISGVSIFTIINIILQNQGKEKAMQELWLIWLVSVFSYIILAISSLSPSYITASFNQIFGNNLKIFASSTIALLTSLILNIKLYYFLRRAKNKIWISNILSGIIVQFVYTLIYFLLSAHLYLPLETLFGSIIITSGLRILINTIETIPLYIISKER